ncbi:MAG: hypothetical protein U0939_12145 [Pirellulales bacterium]
MKRSLLSSSMLVALGATALLTRPLTVSRVYAQQVDGPPATTTKSEATAEPPKRISAADLEETLVLIGELDERMKLAELKLERDSIDRKHEIGKLRGLLAAADQQIRMTSASIQRKEEKLKQLRQEVLEEGADETKVTAANAAYERLSRRIAKPLEEERARLEKLGRQRAAFQQKVERLREELVSKLMEASESNSQERSSNSKAIDDLLEAELAGDAAPKPKP